jgi:acyl-CoA synthetase (AMP-forming)/AMP-acid ligase II
MRPFTVGELYDRAVRHGGDRIALAHGARSITYAGLGRDALCFATALQSLGIGRHDRIAFLMANCIEYVACEYAVAKVGATRVPLATLLANDDHVYMMNFARCRALVYHRKFADRVEAMLPRLESVQIFVCVGDDQDDLPTCHLHFAALLAAHSASPTAIDVDAEDIAGIYFTGGTTGRPKGVMLSHRSWFHTYYAELLDFDIGWREIFVLATPITHAAGCLLLPVLLRQGRCVLLDRFDPALLLETIAAERATATLLVPTMIYLLLDHPDRRPHPAQRALRRVGDRAGAPRTGHRGVRTHLYAVFRPDRGPDGPHLAAQGGPRRPGSCSAPRRAGVGRARHLSDGLAPRRRRGP